MIESICRELTLQKAFFTETVSTIYLGGGTPSLIDSKHIFKLLDEINNIFETNPLEVTLEANPEDISRTKLNDWQSAGINRISLGIQTFDDSILQSLNRSHTGADAFKAVKLIEESGIENLTVDLMYGLPDQDLKTWEANLQNLLDLDIPHLSAYALTIEEKTVFGNRASHGLLPPLADEQYRAQYELMCLMLAEHGFEHYEVSNFAKPGFRSRHNQSYWQGSKYLGIGPGAHSYDGKNRYFNISNNARYIRDLAKFRIPHEVEELSTNQQYNEYLLTRLRTNNGIDTEFIKSRFDIEIDYSKGSFIAQCIKENLAYLDNDKLILTEAGFFVSDAIILELMS